MLFHGVVEEIIVSCMSQTSLQALAHNVGFQVHRAWFEGDKQIIHPVGVTPTNTFSSHLFPCFACWVSSCAITVEMQAKRLFSQNNNHQLPYEKDEKLMIGRGDGCAIRCHNPYGNLNATSTTSLYDRGGERRVNSSSIYSLTPSCSACGEGHALLCWGIQHAEHSYSIPKQPQIIESERLLVCKPHILFPKGDVICSHRMLEEYPSSFMCGVAGKTSEMIT